MPQHPARTWRRFPPPESRRIEAELALRGEAYCPGCGRVLVEHPRTRLAALLPSGARGADLDSRRCRRFHARVQHTPGSLRVVRLRRLAAAVLRA